MRWKKIGQPFFQWPPHIQDDNGTLTFKGVANDDAGKYICIATSSQGIINATINVDVVGEDICDFMFKGGFVEVLNLQRSD